MTDVLRIARLRIAHRVANPLVGNSEIHPKYLSSRRASAQAVISKWQLRTTSPMNTNSLAGENEFSAKKGLWLGRL